MRQQAYEVLDGLIKSNNNSSGGGQSIDIECNESFVPTKVKYNNNSVDVLQENEGGYGEVNRIRDTDFNNYLINNSISYINITISNPDIFVGTMKLHNPIIMSSVISSTILCIIGDRSGYPYGIKPLFGIEVYPD